MEESRSRQNARLNELEEKVEHINDIAVSVEKLALSVQTLAEAQKLQSERIEAMEKRDGEKWRTTTSYLITAFLGIAIGVLTKFIGL
ncbi:MAG: hypothetical protein MJ168_08110 [Clostridia bacterium]|nr:hypothetical protein [Clostridia bacterium]